MIVDALTLSGIGATALTEGIKFLYEQASEVLKRWRERKDPAAKATAPQPRVVEPIEVVLPSIFEGQTAAVHIHFDAVERLEEQLRGLRKDIADYADGIETVDTADENLLQRVDALRCLLEAIYQQRLTFRGELRSLPGPVLEGRIDVEEVAGYIVAVRARKIASGHIKGDAAAKRVETGGQIIGIETDIVGG